MDPEERLKIAITGASGLIGSRLSEFLAERGHDAVPLVRERERAGDGAVYWNVRDQEIDADSLEGIDALVHLAGENIFGRWTASKKERIYDSRKDGTELVSKALAGLDRPPEVLVSASGANYYGDRGDEVLDESSSSGEGFLAEVCRVWEASTEPASLAGIRVVRLRSAVVLSEHGGALAMMRLPFKLGLGGRIGSGEQFMPWIHIDDHVRAIYAALLDDQLDGPVNSAAPNPVRNREFVKTLADVLHRPSFVPVPALGAKLVFGQMADEALLASMRVVPARLEQSGFEWLYPRLEPAIRAEFG
jgi:uncharacterized protein